MSKYLQAPSGFKLSLNDCSEVCTPCNCFFFFLFFSFFWISKRLYEVTRDVELPGVVAATITVSVRRSVRPSVLSPSWEGGTCREPMGLIE